MSLEVFNKIKDSFLKFEAKLSHLYFTEGKPCFFTYKHPLETIYAHISSTTKKIYIINDPIDFLEANAESDFLSQFVKKICLSFARKFPALLPYYLFIGSHMLEIVNFAN